MKHRPGPKPSREGLPFLGYRVMADGRVLLSRASRLRFRRRLAEAEAAYESGDTTARDLQRRVDALLAFTTHAECRVWRRRVVARAEADF